MEFSGRDLEVFAQFVYVVSESSMLFMGAGPVGSGEPNGSSHSLLEGSDGMLKRGWP